MAVFAIFAGWLAEQIEIRIFREGNWIEAIVVHLYPENHVYPQGNIP